MYRGAVAVFSGLLMKKGPRDIGSVLYYELKIFKPFNGSDTYRVMGNYWSGFLFSSFFLAYCQGINISIFHKLANLKIYQIFFVFAMIANCAQGIVLSLWLQACIVNPFQICNNNAYYVKVWYEHATSYSSKMNAHQLSIKNWIIIQAPKESVIIPSKHGNTYYGERQTKIYTATSNSLS